MQFAVKRIWLCDNIYYDLLNNGNFLIFYVEIKSRPVVGVTRDRKRQMTSC